MQPGATNLKQTPPHHQPVLTAIGEVIHWLPHHAKPFRKRHILYLLAALLFIVVIAMEIAAATTRHSLDPRALFSEAATSPATNATIKVRSSNGFGFVFDNDQFTAKALASSSTDGLVTDLSKNAPLNSVTLSPLPSQVPPAEAATELEVRVETDEAAFATFKASADKRSDITEITADYFAPKPTDVANISEEFRTTEVINSSLMTKTVYVVTPKFAGNPTKTIVWTTQVEGKPVALIIRGIIGEAVVPSSMQPVLSSMQFNTDAKVQGLSAFSKDKTVEIEQKYVADLVSPAVVKVYHIVCGSLEYEGVLLSDDVCTGSTGSGFLVSSDGYIATNGHVVVYGAKDMLVNALLSNRQLLEQFLSSTHLTTHEIEEVLARPDLTASVISKIYDVPDNHLRFSNQRELTVVALGQEPFDVRDQAALKRVVANFEPSDHLRQATVVGYDYESRDKLTVLSDPDAGFSASDVALLKTNINDAPMLSLDAGHVTQNQHITLFGFPSDADNELTDNTELGVTVTNGTVNAIRQAAGSSSKLYQSDADASRGNSGGPAVDSEGRVLGLLTYRYASGAGADSAKSYIRDINDFKDLLKSKNVTLTTESQTQEAWRNGLSLYSKRYYKKALVEFEKVSRLYPSHRLASTYIDMSKRAIEDGRNISDPPILLLWLSIGAGLGGLAMVVSVIARHHGHHRVYRVYHQHQPKLQHTA